MNAVENRRSRFQARGSALRPAGFPLCPLEAFGNKETTLKRLKSGNLREAHDRNDATLERIYIGRRFKNDTERLEKLFELYTQMTSRQAAPKKPAKRKAKGDDA